MSNTAFIPFDLKVFYNNSAADSCCAPSQGKKTEIPIGRQIFSFQQINGDKVQYAGFFLTTHIPSKPMVSSIGVVVSHFESFCVLVQLLTVKKLGFPITEFIN